MGMDRRKTGVHQTSAQGATGLCDEAEDWFARLLDENCPAETRAAFERWLAADPAHAAAYREIERVWKQSRDAVKDPALAAAADRALRGEPSRARAKRWLIPAMAAGFAMVAAVIVLPRWLAPATEPAGTAYVTPTGQQQTISLSDGSSIVLDTHSEVVVRYSTQTRRIDLLHGQAQFSVQGNPAWPFVVHAGHGTVTAVGTQFQVRLDDDATHVALLHGKLAIATISKDGLKRSASLIGGQGLSFDAKGLISPVHSIDSQRVRGWTEGKLFVHDWRLPALLAEMNRYHRTQLRVGDPSLQNVHISGVFHTHDEQTLLQALQQGWNIRATRVSATQVVLVSAR